MEIVKVAAFASGDQGGNPAGVVVIPEFPPDDEMLKIAADVGFSETVFAQRQADGAYRVRYFSPSSEVPFCGHATIALGSVLFTKEAANEFRLVLNESEISVSIDENADGTVVSLASPPTKSMGVSGKLISEALDLFGYARSQLDTKIEPAHIHAGADHLLIALSHRKDLAAMQYSLGEGRAFMQAQGFVTIMLVWRENDQVFHVRNAFPVGNIIEDPATGAAAAALSGYLRDIRWPHGNRLKLIQGVDMGVPCIIHAEFDDEPGSPITVSGSIRVLNDV